MHGVMKKIGIGLSIFTLLSSTSLAAEKTLHEVKFTIGQAKYQVGDTIKEIDTAPYIKNGRTMLPIRYVGEIIGVLTKDITWDEMSKTVTIFKGNSIIQMGIGDYTLIKDGQRIVMDTAPEIVNGRTMLPVSYIAKALDIEMKWNSIAKTVTVFTEKDVVESEKEEITWDYQYDQLLEMALKNSKDLKKTEMLVDKAEELEDNATEKFKSTNAIPKEMLNLAPDEDQQKYWDSKHMVYRNLKAQRFALAKAEKDVETMKEKIAYDLKNAYYDVLKSENNKKLAELGLEIQREMMRHANLRYEQKMASEYEKNKAKKDYEEAKKNYEMSQKALDTAYETLNYLVGLNPEERYILKDQVAFDQIPEIDLDLDSHIPTIINKSPQIWALEQQIDLAQLGLDLFVFNYDGDYEATKIDRKTLDIDLSNLKEAYEENLRKLHTALETLKKQYDATQIALEKAQDDLAMAKLNFEVGNAIELEVKAATLKVEELKKQLNEIIMNYNDKATLYEKPWLAF